MAATSRKPSFGTYTRLALVGVLVLIGVLVATSIAQAAVSISRAELSGTQLRIEGQASPNRTITPTTFPDGNVGTLNTWFFSTTGCRTSEKPVRFSVVSGQIPRA